LRAKCLRNGSDDLYKRNAADGVHSRMPDSVSDSSWWPVDKISEKTWLSAAKQPSNSIDVKWRTEMTSVGNFQFAFLRTNERRLSWLWAMKLWVNVLFPPSAVMEKCVMCLNGGISMFLERLTRLHRAKTFRSLEGKEERETTDLMDKLYRR